MGKRNVQNIINCFESASCSSLKNSTVTRFWDYSPKINDSVPVFSDVNRLDKSVNSSDSSVGSTVNKALTFRTGHPLYGLVFNVKNVPFIGLVSVLTHSGRVHDEHGNLVSCKPFEAFISPHPDTINKDRLATVEGVDVDVVEQKFVPSFVYGFNNRAFLMPLSEFHKNYDVYQFKPGYTSLRDDNTNADTSLFSLKDGHYIGKVGEYCVNSCKDDISSFLTYVKSSSNPKKVNIENSLHSTGSDI